MAKFQQRVERFPQVVHNYNQMHFYVVYHDLGYYWLSRLSNIVLVLVLLFSTCQFIFLGKYAFVIFKIKTLVYVLCIPN